jgi:hypothetical protein
LSNVDTIRCTSPEELAELYPRLLSERRFDDWAGLFAEGAIIVRVEAGAPTRIQSVAAALPEQIEYGEENSHFVESWEDVSIVRMGSLAVITARYFLDVDHETRRGIDILTLVDARQGWRIATLAYEQHEFLAK